MSDNKTAETTMKEKKKETPSSVKEMARACLSGEINDPDYDSSAYEKMAEEELSRGVA